MKINYWAGSRLSAVALIACAGGVATVPDRHLAPDTVTYLSQLPPTPRTQRQTAAAPDPNLAPSTNDAKVQSSSR
jgi:hypothetical protein